jgi:hypothetical protein
MDNVARPLLGGLTFRDIAVTYNVHVTSQVEFTDAVSTRTDANTGTTGLLCLPADTTCSQGRSAAKNAQLQRLRFRLL